MITNLYGVLIDKQAPQKQTAFVWIKAAHLTYEIQVSDYTFQQLPGLDQEVMLYTHFMIRQEEMYLYGFAQLDERVVFQELLKIKGIGPKVALNILSQEVSQLLQCIAEGDVVALHKLFKGKKGAISQKTLERLMIEMRGRTVLLPQTKLSPIQRNAISGLINLGYPPQLARKVISDMTDLGLSIQEMILKALMMINQHGPV